MTTAVLAGEGLEKSFGGLRVLTGVSFRVAPAEIVALIGPNGAGKTTLFNLISGLDRPSAGRISVNGTDTTGWPAFRIARLGVGRTFQTPRLMLDLTAAENVRAAALFARRPGPPPDRLLELVGVSGDAPAHRLSIAWRKLLELAMAMVQGPRAILLDEILAGLTPAELGPATRALTRMRDEWGVAIFWTEHVMRAVMATADRAIVLHHGLVICEGPPRHVVADARVREAYLGHAPDLTRKEARSR